nr:protein SHQ1 homolog isoform X2 [Procambarus clarkii]
MLTPKFEATQDDSHLTVKIFAPYSRISDAEIDIDGKSFTFYSSPYYLRLTFSSKLVDSELEKHTATFDADSGAFVVVCEKETPGEHFSNLDMLTTLLTPHGATGVNKPLIEVVGDDGGDGDDEEEEEGDDEFNWIYEQTLPEDNPVTAGHKYGFANNTTGVFTTLQSELKGVVDVVDPDNKSVSQRREEKITQELTLFDEDHYLADYFEVDTAQQCVEFIPEFYSITSDEVELSDEDKEDLLKLPRKEHLLDKEAKSVVYLELVDIVYAWCYNHRVTLGENCAESAWNVAKLSSTLSWLDSFNHLKDVAINSVRRSLVFPLVRNWLLSEEVLKDTSQILSLGHKKVLKCLLEIQRFFNLSEPRYLLNQLYITDYCVWIQKVKDNKLMSLADSLKKVKVNKSDVCLDLEDLEVAAHYVLEEEENDALSSTENVNNLVTGFGGLTIIENGAALKGNDNEEAPVQRAALLSNREGLSHLSDSDSSSSDSDSEDTDDSPSSSDSSDSSDDDDDSSEDSDKESSSDSSDLDSDDDTLSDNEDE